MNYRRAVLLILAFTAVMAWAKWTMDQDKEAFPEEVLERTSFEVTLDSLAAPEDEVISVVEGPDSAVLAVVAEASALGEGGDWDAAISLLREAWNRKKGSGELAENLSRALLHRAVASLDSGHASDALLDAQEAWRLSPRSGAPPLAEARAWVAMGRRKDAKRVVSGGLRRIPRHAGLLVMAGDLARAEGEMDRAGRFYAKALLASPDNSAIEALVTRNREEARVLSALATHPATHFEIAYDGSDAVLRASLPDLVADLEDAWAAVEKAFGLHPGDRIQVIVLDRDRYASGAPEWSAGLYDGRIRVAVGDYASERETLRASLRHEHTHAALHRVGARLPTWIQEGLAQLVEGRDPQAARARLRAVGPQAWPDSTALAADWTRWLDRDRVGLAYDTALSVCAWLGEDFGGNAHRRLLQGLEKQGFEEAFRAAFGLSSRDALNRHRLELLKRG